MSHYPQSLLTLIKNLSKLPGIGEKTATRLSMHILKASKKEAFDLAASIQIVKEKVRFCPGCFGLTDQELCNICQDSKRNSNQLCVVEQTDDMISIEKSNAYSGLYHVLHGVLSPMNGIGPDEIKMNELFARINKSGISEVIVATSTSVEGEATASYIFQELQQKNNITITRIASGVPIGGDLKFIDQLTLKRAMERRYSFS